MDFRVTLIQALCVDGRRERNFDSIRSLLKSVTPTEGTQFIVLPELFAIGFRYEDYRDVGPGIPGPTSEFLCEIAERMSAYVVGTGLEEADERFYNTLVVASPQGRVVGTYRKIHPFQQEKDIFVGGESLAMFKLDGINVGVEICYDIRFPEVSRRLALEGAEVILVPAAFPDPRASHWDALLLARAIENQLFVAATNRVGRGNDGKTYFGHSQVVDPWGVRFTRINSEVDIITHLCNTDVIGSVRRQITCYRDRRSEVYERVKWFEDNR